MQLKTFYEFCAELETALTSILTVLCSADMTAMAHLETHQVRSCDHHMMDITELVFCVLSDQTLHILLLVYFCPHYFVIDLYTHISFKIHTLL